jgi:cytochrome c-type biogenesis protein CcmF
VEYIGEQLIWGQLGNALLAVSFCAALLSCITYLFSWRNPLDHGWKNLSRYSFFIHTLSIFSIFGILFYLIYNHRFEYYYVWQHSSTTLPFRYMFACFWEGQEGSFLLWIFWHNILSFFLLRKAGTWEAPVMTVIMSVQVFLCSMVLGIHYGDLNIGSNPFILLREHPDMAKMPFTQMPDYLQRIQDGRGLNPLLQNYWMVIHPPTLFLGFASTVIPFAFAIGGLMTGRVREWVVQAMPYTFFAVMVLGTGILMGAAWAYEALSFGGFWAWDPVENASLVPLLTLIGASHVMIIEKKNGQTLWSCFVLTILTFILILYSTFLTRSGILGDTSVHAFTDLGMTGQLLLYMAFFAVVAIALLILNRKHIPRSHHDESMMSRDFWMFIGVLVLVISAVQITVTTSIPVFNTLFGSKMAPPADAIDFYNSWQIPIAAIICILMAVTQFMKFTTTDRKKFVTNITFSLGVSIALTIALHFVFRFPRIQYDALLFATLFAIIGNLDYWLRIIKGKIGHSGAAIAHVGVGLILLGALISNAKKEVISQNVLNIDLGKDFPNHENIMIAKGDTLRMGEYYVTYAGKEKEDVNFFYEIEYFKPDRNTGTLEKKFSLKPIVQTNPRMGNVSEPATKRFLNRDLYTHITYADLEEIDEHSHDTMFTEPKLFKLRIGDTVATSNSLVVLYGMNKNIDKEKIGLSENDLAVGAVLKLIDMNMEEYNAEPVFIIKDRIAVSKEDYVDELGIKAGFSNIIPDSSLFEITLSEKKSNRPEFIIMKAIIFPQINILWIGCILFIIGTYLSMRKRWEQTGKKSTIKI